MPLRPCTALQPPAPAGTGLCTNPLLFRLRLLKIKDIYKLSCCKLCYRMKKGNLPNYHSLKLNFNIQQMLTRQSNHLYISRISKSVEKQCLSYKIGTEWNSLPGYLTSYNKSSTSFSKLLKKHLLQKYDIPCAIVNCYSCSQWVLHNIIVILLLRTDTTHFKSQHWLPGWWLISTPSHDPCKVLIIIPSSFIITLCTNIVQAPGHSNFF
jgi:hypothetical protein